MLAFVETEIKKSIEFAQAHRAADGVGWTDVYVRQDAPVSIRALNMKKDDIDALISAHLPRFDLVYTGYSSYRERCGKAAAWGTSQQNAIFADWDQDGMVTNVWTQFFESDEKSVFAASKAIVALGMVHSLIYIDWAWSFVCEIVNEEAFTARLQDKLQDIAGKMGKSTQGGEKP